MGFLKNLIRGVNDIKPPSRGLRQPIRNINFPPIRRMPMPAPMPIVPPSPLVPPRSIGDINRFERPPSFERIDEFIPSMPNENPIPFVPPSAPILPPVIPQIPRPLPIQLPIAPPSIGGVGGINQPLQPVLQQPQPPQTGGILGPNLEIGPGTGGIGARPDLPKLPRSSLFGGNVPGGGGIDYGPVELGPIERPIPQVPNPLQKMPVPPKRDDFMSIGGPGGGRLLGATREAFENNPNVRMGGSILGSYENPIPFKPPFEKPVPPMSIDRIGNYGLERRNRGIFATPAPDLPPVDLPPISTPVPEPVTTPAPVTPPEPVTPPASTTVAANQPAPVVEPTTTDDPVVVEPPVEPAATTTTTNAGQAVNNPFAASVTQRQTTLDPITQQLLFGLDGQGGFIPGAMRAAEKTFYDDQGNPIVIDEQVAGFSPDQLAAMQMQRQSVGQQDPYLGTAADAYGAGTQALEEGLQRGRTAAIGSLAATRGGLGSLRQGLGESADILRGTVGGYDPSMTERFYDPYEDRVVQQTISDIMEQGAKSDIGARASDIARGGESAFGSRARLGASERQRAIGRGLAEALGGIRSQGFRQAQQTGLGEFARQKAAERAASSGLAGLAGQGFTGQQALAGALSGLGQTEQNIGQQRYSGQFGLGSSLQGLGAQAAGASASDIAALYGMGAQQQGQTQQMLDAQRRNLQQRQMTPLLQYQALQPFVSMAPAGQFQTDTSFVPAPSPVQAGMGVGLSAFGALGQLYGGKN